MKSALTLIPRWARLSSLIFAAIAALCLRAQSTGTGTIQGRVYNPATKEYIRNAEVRLEGTNQSVFTENDGSFQFLNVPAGDAKITVNFSGYIPATETFNVTAGQTAVREINLTSTAATSKDVVQLSAFTVSSEREGNAKAVQAQRKDMNIITSVSSDIFGQIMDGNVGEFLKYLPGVDLEYVESEPRGPRLGGMDIQYTGVSFDGMRTASADANRGGGAASRATSFEGFSMTAVDSIEINRTASPENDADAPAGFINMKTKRAFERKGRQIAYNTSLNFNGEEFTFKKTSGITDNPSYKWKPNWTFDYSEPFFNNRFGLLLSASHGSSYTEQASETVTYSRQPNEARPLLVRQIAFGDGPKFIIKDALLLTADWKVTQRLTLSLNVNYSYFEGHFWNRSFTWTAGNDNTNVNNGRPSIGGDGVLTIIAPNSGAANVSNGGGSSAKLTYTRQYSPKFEYRVGPLLVDGAFAFSKSVNNYESLERGFINGESGTVTTGWTATRPNISSWEWEIRQGEGNDWYDLRNWVDTNSRSGGARINNDNRTWKTEKWTGVGNVTWNVPFMRRFPTRVKFGGKWDQETRDNRTDSDLDIWSYVGPGGNTPRVNPNTLANENAATNNWGNVGPQFYSTFPFDMGTSNSLTVYDRAGNVRMVPRVNRLATQRLFREHPEQFVWTATPENWYSDMYVNARYLVQTIKAAYGQADVRLTSQLTIRFGERVELTQNALREFDPLTRAELLARGVALNPPATNGGRPLTFEGMKTMFETKPRVWRRSEYTRHFPSFVFKYQILPNLEWQAGANRSIGRPGVNDLTGVWVLDDNRTPPRITTANPQIQPENHKVYQTRLAYYFQGRSPGQISIALIEDEATNFITTQLYSYDDFQAYLGTPIDPEFSNYEFNSTRNVGGIRRHKNLDFNYNQTLGFLPSEWLRGISIGGTYSRSYTNQARDNVAPHRLTGRLGYAKGRFNGSIGVIWVDDRRNGQDYRIWGAMTKYDLSLSWRLNRYATLYVTSRNPTNQKDMFYEAPPGVPGKQAKYLRSQEGYGDNWIFGVRGTF